MLTCFINHIKTEESNPATHTHTHDDHPFSCPPSSHPPKNGAMREGKTKLNLRHEVLNMVFLQNYVSWHVTLSHWAHGYQYYVSWHVTLCHWAHGYQYYVSWHVTLCHWAHGYQYYLSWHVTLSLGTWLPILCILACNTVTGHMVTNIMYPGM